MTKELAKDNMVARIHALAKKGKRLSASGGRTVTQVVSMLPLLPPLAAPISTTYTILVERSA